MTIDNQLCSLELSKKLRKLGSKQDSLFWHVNNYKGQMIIHKDQLKDELCEYGGSKCCSAFTASELGDLLPNGIQVKDAEPFDCFRIFITKFNSVDEKGKVTNNFIVNYECDSTEATGENAWLRRKITSNVYDPILANAMAKMLTYLLESGLIKHE